MMGCEQSVGSERTSASHLGLESIGIHQLQWSWNGMSHPRRGHSSVAIPQAMLEHLEGKWTST